MSSMHNRLRGVLGHRSDPVEMRRSKSQHGMHEVFMLLREFGDLVHPDGFIAKWEMGICHREEVVKESHIRHGEGIACEAE